MDARLQAMEQELQASKEANQAIIEELEAANEELLSTNEEIQSANEELQSSNEELETTKEELQSTNEELMTVNAELQNKVEELTAINNDIDNLLAGTEIGTIFLDRHLRIKRFTPFAAKLFSLIPTDLDRSLTDITSRIKYDRLEQDAQEVLATLQTKEMEIETREGGWFTMRIMPYRTRENVIAGVVLTFTDITRLKHLGQQLQGALHYAQGIVETVREPLMVLNGDLKVQSANQFILSDLPDHAAGDRGPPDLRVGQRPVGHSPAAATIGGDCAPEQCVRELRGGARFSRHRGPHHDAQRPAPGSPARPPSPYPPGHGGRHQINVILETCR